MKLNTEIWDFNSHAHVERDLVCTEIFRISVNFNSHAHVERDPTHTENYINLANFNSHAHVERDVLQAV